MPEQIGREVAEHLEEAVQEIRKLVTEVAQVNKKYDEQEARRDKDRRQVVAVAVVSVLSVITAIGGMFMWYRLSSVVDDQKDARAEGRITNCIYTNSQNERTRQKFITQDNQLKEALPSPDAQAIIDSLLGALPTPNAEDRDCNSDGWLTSADYERDTVPANLPIQALKSLDDTVPPTETES